MSVKGECSRCGNTCHPLGTLCTPCSDFANRVIARWLDGGDAPREEIEVMLGLSRDVVKARAMRIRRALRRQAA